MSIWSVFWCNLLHIFRAEHAQLIRIAYFLTRTRDVRVRKRCSALNLRVLHVLNLEARYTKGAHPSERFEATAGEIERLLQDGPQAAAAAKARAASSSGGLRSGTRYLWEVIVWCFSRFSLFCAPSDLAFLTGSRLF